ncbi:MAG: hypothetical protein QXL16_01115 [Candidatus Micrarchaeaceae archaeon]
MEYKVEIGKRFRYVKVYSITKRIGKSENIISKYFEKFVNKYLVKNNIKE